MQKTGGGNRTFLFIGFFRIFEANRQHDEDLLKFLILHYFESIIDVLPE